MLPDRSGDAPGHRHGRVVRPEMPRWHPISISGYHIREAGSTAQQELAFTLKDGFTYVEQAIERGLDVDSFAPRLSFFFNAHIDFFEEIAKYRAARRIWAREMRDTYGAKRPESLRMRFHTQTAGVSLTAQQPLLNIVRTAIEALAGVLGGTQSLHTNSYDEALALPTEEAVRIALRTQQVIAHETGVTNAVDPLGGSYLVERLTDEMERRPTSTSRGSTSSGGWSRRSSAGFPQREIADASFRYQQEVDSGERVVVGVNRYQLADEPEPELHRADPAIERKQAERLSSDPGRARLGGGRAPRGAEGGRRHGPKPDAVPARGGPGAGLRGRDDRRAPGGLRQLHRSSRSSDRGLVRRPRKLPPHGRRSRATRERRRGDGRSASWSPSPGSTATIAGRRSSPGRCATPGWRSSTRAFTRRPSRSPRP